MKNIKYLIRKRALGDVLWIEPVIRQLAPRYKKLIVYTKHPLLFENYPFPNVVFKNNLSFLEKAFIYFEKKLGANILTINLDDSYENDPNIHFLNAYLKKAGLAQHKEYPKIYLSDQEKSRRIIEGKYVILHIESFSDKKFRQVYGVDWEAINQYLHNKGYKVIQIGTNPTEIRGSVIVKTSIRDLMSLCYNASFFIGIDSGPSHIAASLKVPSIIFFGAVNPLYRHFPDLFNGMLLKKACEYDNEQGKIISEQCVDCKWSNDTQTATCSTYSTEEILSAINQLLK